MQPETRDPAYVWDMLDAAKTVVVILSGKTKDDWDNDIVLRMAVERGKALKKLSRPKLTTKLSITIIALARLSEEVSLPPPKLLI